METKFNVNHKVRFKMLERGWDAYYKYYKDLGLPPQPLEVDEDGWSEMQLWKLMSMVGSACYMGPEPPFETEIILINE